MTAEQSIFTTPRNSPRHAWRSLALSILLACGAAETTANETHGDCTATADSISALNQQVLENCISPSTEPATAFDHDNPVVEKYAHDLARSDWHRATGSSLCEGYYVNPIAAVETGNGSNAGSSDEIPITASADNTSLEQDTVILEGNVLIDRGAMVLRADNATVERQSGNASLYGNVVIRNSESAFGGTRADIDMNAESVDIKDANYIIHGRHIRGTAKSITSSGGVIEVNDGSYTYCAPGNKLWRLKAGEIVLNRETGQGKAKHAHLEISGTPVAYSPYARFPIGNQRQSGFLFPSISSSDDGIDLTAPYYFNIAPNFDATLAPRYNQDRGTIVENELRWLNRFDRWTVSAAFLDGDDVYEEEFPEDSNGDRWVVNIKEYGQYRNHWLTHIDFTRASDDRFFRDLNTTSLSLRRTTHLQQRAQLQYIDDNLSSGINVHQYQTIDNNSDRPFEKRPELWLDYERWRGDFKPHLAIKLRYTDFEHESRQTAKRAFGELNINYPARWKNVTVTATTGVQHLEMKLDDVAASMDDNIEVTVPQASLDIAARFSKSTGGTEGFSSHRLEPGIFYLYREDKGQANFPLFDTDLLTLTQSSLTRATQLSGYDRLEGANQVAVRIRYSWHNSRSGTRLESVTGKIFSFSSANSLANSGERIEMLAADYEAPIFTETRLQKGRWRTDLRAEWQPQRDQFDRASLVLGYHAGGDTDARENRIVNAGYHFRRRTAGVSVLQDDIEFADFSMSAAFGKRWRAFGRHQYDLGRNDHSESLGGLEYDSCCVRIKLVYREGLVYQQDEDDDLRDRSLFLQFELKGLFGLGNGVEGVLREQIFGYGDYGDHYLEQSRAYNRETNPYTSF